VVGEIVGFRGEPVFDASKPNGMPRKLIGSNRLRDPRLETDDPLAGRLEAATNLDKTTRRSE
jgi:hypothetical protein